MTREAAARTEEAAGASTRVLARVQVVCVAEWNRAALEGGACVCVCSGGLGARELRVGWHAASQASLRPAAPF